MLDKLGSENSYQRSIGILLLCNLAKSDSEDRLRHSLDRLLAHTRDEKFITERQCVQNIWKTAATNRANREKVLKHLEEQFVDCAGEKHYNLLRLDIIQSMVALYKWEGDSELLRRAQSLIAQEPEAKYRKQYQALLRTN